MPLPLDAQFVDVPIFNQLVPGEGPKAIRAVADFSSVDGYVVDMTVQQEQGIIKAVQTLYIDTTDADQPVTFVAGRSQQRLTVLPGKQGYFPFLLPNPPVFEVQSAASVGSIVVFIMLNVPMACNHWDVV